MALIIKDRVKETTTTAGVIPFVCGGAVVEFQSFSSAIGDANTTLYVAEDIGGTNWEVGVGQYVQSNNSLLRTSILASSNNSNIVNFPAGSKNLFVTIPAAYAALTARDLSQFAATSSANLASIITDETGSGQIVFSNNAVLANATLGTANATTIYLTNDLRAGNVYSNGQIVLTSEPLANAAYSRANSAYTLASTPQSSLANSSYTLTLRSDGQVVFPQTVVGAYNAAGLTTTGAFVFNANGNLWQFDVNGNLISPYNVQLTTAGIKFPDGSSQNTAASPASTTQAAYNTANTVLNRTFTFFQNTAPTSSNTRDQWIHADTGVLYENFGNTSSPIWAETGPTGLLSNTTPGLISATQVTTSYTPQTATGAGIQVSAANTQGGVGYSDFLKVTNASGGATNPNKWFRLDTAGTLQIINSAYNTNIFNLTDAGTLNVPVGPIQVAGNTAVNGPAFSAYVDAGIAAQTITTGSLQKVTFSLEEYDTNNNFASSRFTPTVAGYYQLNATVRFDGATGTGEQMIVLYKNGVEYKRGWNASGVQWASSWWSMSVNSTVYANGSTDYFEIYVQQGSGGSSTITRGATISWFNGCMIRGA